MIDNFNSKIENKQMQEDASEAINLSIILNLILRNKAIIGLISLVTFFFGVLYSFTLKEVWEGQFQIVVNEKQQSLGISSQLANLAGVDIKQSNGLKTQVEILKSPSVLMPVFEFAKSQNNKSLENNLRFSNWKRSNLKIDLQRNTSILNIAYQNKNKKTIIPVLNKMSITYQQYSEKNKKRRQELTNKFLSEQITIFKKKSADSLRAAQEYATDQDLVFYDLKKITENNIDNNNKDLSINTLLQGTNFLLPNIGVENARVQAANEIRQINLQLQAIEESNDSDELKYIASTIPTLVDEGLPQVLSEIEANLFEARSKYTNQDISVTQLMSKKQRLIDLIKKRTIKYLEVQKLNAESTMKAAMRPKGVLLKYKELIRKAARDEQTLIQLEDRFNLFKLDMASQEVPWELITKPTLLENRISPNRKKIALNSLILGLILGIIFSLLKEKKSGLIYDISEIERLIPIKLIAQINLSKIDSETQNLLFIKNLLNKESKNLINLVPIGNIETQELEKLKESIINKKTSENFELYTSKDDIDKYSNYLILKLGYLNYSDVLILKKRIDLLENKFNGLIVLS